MRARAIIEAISEETGVAWNLDSIVEVMSEYIDNQDSFDAFEDFVRHRAEEENTECTIAKGR